MLKILYELKPFFEDTYREISVREYARESKVSPPTASKRLTEFQKEGLVILYKKGIYHYYRANRETYLFLQLTRLYWYSALHHLAENLYSNIAYRRIILFGSLTKAENTKKSDVDLFLDIDERKIDTSLLKKALNRTIELHFASSMKNEQLKKNIEQGIVIR
ncbi:nucleotidyltransferase domain-containing protein [Candidatus Woesearchaeota archaeon]|nr:nucleotidyltransferase domain-containing protein [Candidatus Woesearchaeota archaeon]